MAGKLKTKVIRPFRDLLLYSLLKSLFMFSGMFPRKFILLWHGLLAIFAFDLCTGLRKNILKQLSLAYGKEKNAEELYRMGQEVFIHLSKTFTDYAIFSQMTTRQQFSKYFTVEGEEHLQKAYEKGKGVLCLVPHTAGWEFSAIMPPVLGYETSAVSCEIRNPALNRLLIGLREKRAMKNISRKKNTYEKLVDVLHNGECLIIMIDQDSKKVRGEFLQFFGMNAYTPLGCARLAMETGAAVVPMATFRRPDDTYLFKILPEEEFQLSGDKEFDLRHNTQIYNDIMESLIRQYPTQWVWMHKRWNTTPKSLKEFWDKKRAERPQFTVYVNGEKKATRGLYIQG
ncbi:lysophospholipid acyltransferase family protein [Odoribacter sp. OttesenSCG-928-J03]|nr:lysophospholipid acyltransferase family protein [Odoribacter sp. OttesenSCG-928-J03]MDL2283154.1 lysophospholipid acyltransferase family protein [Odoribacter sp. OttesenSCG-928-G04]MDL2330510.1 lysophospholipid acyltransferase family protein [Odoribacter sp. OttesenSCG-928-A06]